MSLRAAAGAARVVSAGLLALAGCTSVPHQPALPQGTVPTRPSETPAPQSPAQLLQQVQDLSTRIQAEKDAAARYRLIGQALYWTASCDTRWPGDGTCPYATGLIQGLTARENPARAVPILRNMLANLARAQSLAPAIDHAGPERLTAIVLLRAPGWPLGPGDPDAALAAAQRAVALDAGYPPNLITLGQAQAATGDAAAAHRTFGQALEAAQAAAAGPDRDGWIRDARQGLKAG
ncbi:MAG TPA: hypothetical protein VMB48_17805 [Steroidobacteraceae bacterium]|nr:hypothetical protein [Steroidobacteraceae bacterium]